MRQWRGRASGALGTAPAECLRRCGSWSVGPVLPLPLMSWWRLAALGGAVRMCWSQSADRKVMKVKVAARTIGTTLM